jgi:chemotaxis protein MotA
MYVILGIIIVLGSVIGGYTMEKGNINVLFQPAEIVIIFGAAFGSLLISSPPKVLKLILKDFGKIFKDSSTTGYIELLSLLNNIFSKITKDGFISIEADIEYPRKSTIFQKYNNIISDKHILDFICDNLRVIMTINMSHHDLDSFLDIDIEANYSEALIPSISVAKIADALPGLGIVAAVLGVVLAMGKIDEPPAVIGHSIAAALVGTFLGVLLSYGFVSPVATNLEHKANESEVFFRVIKTALVSFVSGAPPQIAVESARRAIPKKDRPSFIELEKAIRK